VANFTRILYINISYKGYPKTSDNPTTNINTTLQH